MKYQWILKAGNGQIIAKSSRLFDMKSAATNQIESVKKHSWNDALFEVQEVEEEKDKDQEFKKCCLQIALKKWEENDKKGYLMHDHQHVHCFEFHPRDMREEMDYQNTLNMWPMLTDHEKQLLKEYLQS